MKKIYTAISSNIEYKGIVKNFFSLGVIQVTNFLVPVILLPYLIRTLGITTYGAIVFAQTIIGYFESVMQYSFSLTAVNEVAQNVKSPDKLRAVLNKVVSAKCLLAVTSAGMLLLLAMAVPQFAEIRPLLFLGTIYCLGNLLNFEWFFQGIQDMKQIAFLNLIARGFSIIWVFSMVHSSKDIFAAFLTVPLSYLLTGICSVFLLRWKFQMVLQFSNLQDALGEIKKGFHIFYAQIMVRFYSADINITILGFIADSTTVGLYALAQRIFALFMVLTNLITVIIFPFLSGLYTSSFSAYQRKTKQAYSIAFVAFAMLAIAIFASAPWLIFFVSGQHNETASICLRILSVALLLSPFPPLNNQVLIISGRTKWMPILASMAVIVNLTLVGPAYLIFQLPGIAITNVIVFGVLVSGGLFVICREHILFANTKGIKH